MKADQLRASFNVGIVQAKKHLLPSFDLKHIIVPELFHWL